MIKLWKLWALFAAFCLAGCYILQSAVKTMYVEDAYWMEVKERFTQDSVCVPALRGNIISADGKVMVSSVPQYELYLDLKVGGKDSVARAKTQAWRDSALRADIDTIAYGLATIFPDRTADWFKQNIEKAKSRGRATCRLYPRLATYNQYLACRELPLLKERSFKGGFHADRKMLRKKLYGSLAARTLGDIDKDSLIGSSGLEWCYDSILRGHNGYSHNTKVRDRRVTTIDREPENGHDLVTTIDTRMQDIAEKALLDKLTEPDMINQVEKGVAIVMEVATGDIKALVSMTKPTSESTNFYEIVNDAINARWEPGSTFKTASLMVALEDGYITPDTRVDCAHGIYNMHGRFMKDHNHHRGGYGTLTATEVLGQSSNIGVSRLIDENYHDQPDKFVRGLYNLGVGIDYHLPMGANPKVRMPVKSVRGKFDENWSKTALAWMSIGYEVELTPLNTLIFYNAIANNGRMVKPRFVTKEIVGGQVVREFPVEVIKEKMCSDKTLSNIQMMLEKVVSEGLGKKAGNRKFRVSGKTGTAQVATNGSYAHRNYMVSFCGYFPSDSPKYSCIVCIKKRGLPASGGGQCGPVFSQISQHIMNQGHGKAPSMASDSTSIFTPDVAAGNEKEAKRLLRMMDIPWKQEMEKELAKTEATEVPDVTGMGARDAVHALQAAGMTVKVNGTGRVKSQSIAPGTKNANGRTITINMN